MRQVYEVHNGGYYLGYANKGYFGDKAVNIFRLSSDVGGAYVVMMYHESWIANLTPRVVLIPHSALFTMGDVYELTEEEICKHVVMEHV